MTGVDGPAGDRRRAPAGKPATAVTEGLTTGSGDTGARSVRSVRLERPAGSHRRRALFQLSHRPLPQFRQQLP